MVVLGWSVGQASDKIPADFKQIADIAIKQYQMSQKLQREWIEVFDQKGFVIAHSHPSRVYRRQPLTQPHYNAVMSVLHSGHSLVQEGSDSAVEEYYPIKFHRKTVGVIEIIKAHQ
jgi:hypothetical protein